MATGVTSWSTNAASNANSDQNVNFAEGMAPSQVNDSARALMGSVALYRNDNAGYVTTAGSSTAYTLTSNQGFASASALVNNGFSVRFHVANANGATITVDGQGPIPLTYDGQTNLATGTIQLDTIWKVTFVSTGLAVVEGSKVLGLQATDQTLTGGFISSTFGSGTFASGTFTPDPGQAPYQVITNNGNFTIAAPTNQGRVTLMIVNGASAGTITWSGFAAANPFINASADAFVTTLGATWFVEILLMNATATYIVRRAS